MKYSAKNPAFGNTQPLVATLKDDIDTLNQEIKISFFDKVKRPNTGNKFVDGLLTILTIPLYPIILFFGLFVMIFSGLLSLWQKLTLSNVDLQKRDILEAETQIKKWNVFVSTNKIHIEQQLAGSLTWDSGDYQKTINLMRLLRASQ
ncbi:MAG: hypothetical protein EBR38_05650 [Flavobacteriaceae bacterium]|nr:hypothetical protein [Flavobacteriaceae bacterium]